MKRTNFAKLTEVLAKKSLLAMAFVCGFLLLGSDASAQKNFGVATSNGTGGVSMKSYLNGKKPVTKNVAITRLTDKCQSLLNNINSGNLTPDEATPQIELEFYRHVLHAVKDLEAPVEDALTNSHGILKARHAEFVNVAKPINAIFGEAVNLLAD